MWCAAVVNATESSADETGNRSVICLHKIIVPSVAPAVSWIVIGFDEVDLELFVETRDNPCRGAVTSLVAGLRLSLAESQVLKR